MQLNDFYFIIFFCATIFFSIIIRLFERRHLKGKNEPSLFYFLIVSFVFLGIADIRFSVLITITGVITYICGLMIQKNACHKQLVFSCGVIFLIVFLGYYKYSAFIVNNLSMFLGIDLRVGNIILPLGISFYIFTEIGYLVDIYRGKYVAEKNLIVFLVFILWFPKVISGPIVRANDFLPQLKQYDGIKWDFFEEGIQIFVFGLFKKIVLADHLGVFVNDVFSAPLAFNSLTVIWAIISYSLQIYFDFSGYSDMAIGISRVVGIKILPNFNLPYISSNISEFWNRWHISLSQWIKDYLYIPLGGSRKGTARTYLNLMIVMLISGLWHGGAGWTFIVWGVLHGILSCIHRAIQPISSKMNGNRLYKLLSIFFTYVFVSIFWIFFRSDTFETAFNVLRQALAFNKGISQPYTWTFVSIVILCISVISAYYKSQKAKEDKINGFYFVMDLSKFWNQVVFFSAIGIIIILGYFGNTSFIYANF